MPERLRLAIGVYKLAKMLSRIEIFANQRKELYVGRQRCTPDLVLKIFKSQADDGTMTQIECHCS